MTEDIHKTARDVFEAARTRRSIRAYKPDPVPPATLREIVAAGRHAPSGGKNVMLLPYSGAPFA